MIRHNAIGNYARALWLLVRIGRVPRWPPEAIRAAQSRQLARLVRSAYARVPYYRRLFDRAGIGPADIATVADLARLPITTKDELRRTPLADRVAHGADLDRCWRTTSSGSSGTPLTAYRDATCSCLFYALTVRALHTAGARITDSLLVIGPGYYPDRLFVQRLGLGRVRSLSPLQPPERLAEALASLRPDILHAYGSVLKSLVDHLRATGRVPHRPRVIVSSADFLDEQTRAACTDLFGTRPIQMYGAVETGRVGSECAHRNGIHVYTDALIPEFVPAGGTLGPAAYRVVLTDLTNLTTPFIRYDQGDLAEPLADPCPCGSPFPRMRLLAARAGDVVRLPAGGTVSALRLGAPLWDEPAVDAFRFVQEAPDLLVAEVVRRNGHPEEPIRAALAVTASHLPGMRVEARFVAAIPRNPSGKVARFQAAARH